MNETTTDRGVQVMAWGSTTRAFGAPFQGTGPSFEGLVASADRSRGELSGLGRGAVAAPGGSAHAASYRPRLVVIPDPRPSGVLPARRQETRQLVTS